MPGSIAKKKWVAEHTTTLSFKLNHNTDVDILKKLASVQNKQGYIKSLIRADISREER